MGRKALKDTERESVRERILSVGMDLIKKGGIHAITLRKVAQEVDYSVGSLYQYFPNKESLLLALATRAGKDLYLHLSKLGSTKNPELDLLVLTQATIAHHIQEPHGVELLTYICFTTHRTLLPEFDFSVDLFRKALKKLNYLSLQTEQDIEDALDMIRPFLAGSTQLILLQDTDEGKVRTMDIVEKVVKTLLCGWKHSAKK